MRHHIVLLTCLVFLGGCTGGALPASIAAGAVAQLIAPALTSGQARTATALSYSESDIAERCAAEGYFFGTASHTACKERVRETLFVAKQGELRGYRGYDQFRLN